MKIRIATMADAEQISKLFYDTVTTINSRDYLPDQIAAWAGKSDILGKFINKIIEQYFIVAEGETSITGFASLTTSGYLDFMFVHKDHQIKGIASLLYSHIERKAIALGLNKITADVSITAKPFF